MAAGIRRLGGNRVGREWEASSFHRYVKLGVYPLDWAGDIFEDGHCYGERP